jgi:hypothetical protein
MLVKCRSRQALSRGISDVLRACAFDNFHGSVSYYVSYEMYSYVHVTRAFAICRVLAQEDAKRVIFPVTDGAKQLGHCLKMSRV